MAFAATDLTSITRFPIGGSRYLLAFKLTGPASYANGGEYLTKTIANSMFNGISNIDFLIPSEGATSTFTTKVSCTYEPINDATNTGRFHFYSEIPAHTHDLLVIGGQTAQTHAHDFLVKGGTAAAGTDEINIKATVIGKEAATDATNLAADVATKGGVQLASTASALSMISTDTLGKEQATNRTIAGSASATKGGVVSTTAGTTTTEVAAAVNLSTFSCWFFGIGN